LELSVDARRRATAVVRNDRGERVERVVDLPKDRTRATESLAWLVGNLARDEASDLLRALEKGQPETPVAGAATAPPEAPTGANPEAPGPEKEAPKPPAGAPAETRTQPAAPRAERPSAFFNLTFVHPLTLVPRTEERTLKLELGFGYSRVGAVQGLAMNLGAVRVERETQGAGVALGFVRAQSVRGVVTALGATSADDVEGAEVALGAAVALRDVRGAQGALFATVANGRVAGIQASAGSNVAGSLDGAQVGLVNVAGKVRGVQVGLVNVADEIDGISVGLVSVADNTRVSALAWASDTEIANVSLKLVTGYGYTQYGAGVRTNPTEYVAEVGLGAHFQKGDVFFEPGVHFQDALSDPGEANSNVVYRGTFGWSILPALGIFAGGGARHPLTRADPKPVYFAGISLF
jgi:hypothetical protein